MLRYGPFSTEAGARLNFVLLQRRFSENGLNFNDQTAGLGTGPYGEFSVQLGPLRLSLEIAGGLLFFANAENTVIPYLESGIAISLGL
jgi:hypothetical protein